MIAKLTGQVDEKFIDHVVINVNGVGYGVFVSDEDFNRLTHGKEVTTLYIYEHIREQAHDLYGFLESSTRQFFELLLSVNGVGPKMALNVLSIGNANEVKQAIAGGNVTYIQKANGAGKRVAERIVVDLKDKVGLISADLSATGLLTSTSNQDEAVAALVSLGFSTTDAARALSSVDAALPVEERVKQALKGN